MKVFVAGLALWCFIFGLILVIQPGWWIRAEKRFRTIRLTQDPDEIEFADWIFTAWRMVGLLVIGFGALLLYVVV